MSLQLEAPLKVNCSIADFWPVDERGQARTVNSIYEEVRGTDLEVGRNTLRLALDGRLERGHFENLVVLARLCSQWSGRPVTVDDLLKVTDG